MNRKTERAQRSLRTLTTAIMSSDDLTVLTQPEPDGSGSRAPQEMSL